MPGSCRPSWASAVAESLACVRRVTAWLAGAALVAAGAAPLAAETQRVAIEGMQFAPGTLTVKRGDTVIWTNRDLVPHTATAGRTFDSRVIAPGASWSWVASQPGRHDYVCSLHPTMRATLVVE
jgi:plastocyanin